MNKIKYIGISFLLLLGVVSCKEDFVELNDPNRNTVETFWQTEDDAIRGINAVYQALHYDGLYMRVGLWNNDVRGDDMENQSPWWIYDCSRYVNNMDNACYNAPYEHNFIGIWRANQVLTYVPFIDMGSDKKNRILGEAYFLRGLYYFHLVTAFKEVPIRTSLPLKGDDYYVAKSEETDVWARVYEDLGMALDLLETKDQLASEDIGRATKGAAAGYLAKTLLFNQRFTEAEVLLANIVDGDYGTYDLVDNYSDNFTESKENNIESLFEVQFDKNVGGTTLGWSADPLGTWSKTSGKARTYAPGGGYGFGDISPTDWIFEEFQLEKAVDGSDDARLATAMMFPDTANNIVLYGDTVNANNLTYALTNPKDYKIFSRKYLNEATAANENEWRSGINERILRYADILLLYAEVLNENGKTAEAYPHIQKVRNRAELPDLVTAKPNMTQQEMREQIYHERALELCFEGQRYLDILRWGWHYNNLATLIEHDAEFERWTTGREYLPITQIVLNQNPLLKPSDGWDY